MTIKTNLLNLLTALLFLTTSCNNGHERKLVGKWRLSDENVMCDFPDRHASKVNGKVIKSGADVIEELRHKEGDKNYEFYSNKKFFCLQKTTGDSHSGTYEFINGDSLILKSDNSAYGVTSYTVTFISDTKLLLKTTSLQLITTYQDGEASSDVDEFRHEEFYDKVKD